MYCNLFDTVRNDKLDYVQAEGLFFHMILSGYHPTLSLNQAVDSTAISVLAGKCPVFLDLIDRDVIRFSLFRDFKSTAAFLASHLIPPKDQIRNSFKFSSLPFLYTGNYTDRDIQRIYDAMLDVLQGGSKAVPGGITLPNSNHADKLTAYVHGARVLSDRLEKKYLDPAPVESELLGRRFENYVGQLQTKRPDIEIPPVILKLRDHIQDFRREKDLDPSGAEDKNHWQLDNRSYLYERIAEFAHGNEALMAQPKAVIDLFYNERVASNISDGEDDLMVTDPGIACLEPYVENDSKEARIHAVAPADATSPYASRFVTWEALKEVCDMVEKDCKRPEERREVLAECCEKVGLPRFEPGSGMAEQDFCFSATVLMALDEAGDLPGSAEENWYMDTACHEMDCDDDDDSRVNHAALKSDFAREDK